MRSTREQDFLLWDRIVSLFLLFRYVFLIQVWEISHSPVWFSTELCWVWSCDEPSISCQQCDHHHRGYQNKRSMWTIPRFSGMLLCRRPYDGAHRLGEVRKQEMFVKHWPPTSSRWNACQGGESEATLKQYMHKWMYGLRGERLPQKALENTSTSPSVCCHNCF